MSTELKQFSINGKPVWVQVDVEPAAKPARGAKAAAAADAKTPHGTGKFVNTSAAAASTPRKTSPAARAIEAVDVEGTLSAVMGPAQAAMAALKPSELSVELKLGFKADAGVFIAKTSADASVTIKAVWKPS